MAGQPPDRVALSLQDLHHALLAGQIIAYPQGFDVLLAAFQGHLQAVVPALRRVVSTAVVARLPVPALAAAPSHLDQLAQPVARQT
ncbi:MAG: hypothetical protein AAGK00_01005 [Pseudomonadota bacterium]